MEKNERLTFLIEHLKRKGFEHTSLRVLLLLDHAFSLYFSSFLKSLKCKTLHAGRSKTTAIDVLKTYEDKIDMKRFILKEKREKTLLLLEKEEEENEEENLQEEEIQSQEMSDKMEMNDAFFNKQQEIDDFGLDMEENDNFHMDLSQNADNYNNFDHSNLPSQSDAEAKEDNIISTHIDKYVHIYEHLPPFPPSHTFRRTIVKDKPQITPESLKKRIEESLRAEKNLFKMVGVNGFVNFLYQQ